MAQLQPQASSNSEFQPGISIVPPDWVDEIWWDVRPMIASAMEPGPALLTPEDVKQMALKGEAQIWVWCSPAITAMCVTRLIEWPKARVCSIELCAGEGSHQFIEGINEIIEWARDMDCSVITAEGRHGWKRLLNWKSKTMCWRTL